MKKLLFLLFMLILSISASSKNFKYQPKTNYLTTFILYMNENNKLRHLSDLNKKLLLKYFYKIYYKCYNRGVIQYIQNNWEG